MPITVKDRKIYEYIRIIKEILECKVMCLIKAGVSVFLVELPTKDSSLKSNLETAKLAIVYDLVDKRESISCYLNVENEEWFEDGLSKDEVRFDPSLELGRERAKLNQAFEVLYCGSAQLDNGNKSRMLEAFIYSFKHGSVSKSTFSYKKFSFNSNFFINL